MVWWMLGSNPQIRTRDAVRPHPSKPSGNPRRHRKTKTPPAHEARGGGEVQPESEDQPMMAKGLIVFQMPRVKSGMATGQEPVVTERAESSRMQLQEAAS